MTTGELTSWAQKMFAGGRYKDARIGRRVVRMAVAAARRPGGTVTSVMATSAEAEAAFRFLESERTEPEVVSEAIADATAQMAEGHSCIFVTMDQTDLTFVDREHVRGLGPSPNRGSKNARSTQVMTAYAVDARGVPLGVLDQRWWCWPEHKTGWGSTDKRPVEQRERWKWVESFEASHARLAERAPSVVPWYVMDAAADYGWVFERVLETGARLTVRSASERYFLHRGKQRGLRSTLSRQPVIGHLHVQIPSSSERVARRANLEVRVAHGAIRSTSRPVKWLPISAVRLREVETVPSGESPISWTLLTTHAVQTLSQAQEVLHSYVMRWRIEEFHKTWKSGACCVEQSQLRSFNAIRRWATILAAVAARVERLKQLSREQPDLDALKELSREEIDSAILLSEHKKYRPGDALTIREAVRLIARVGGYLDRKGDGPPGSITIRRGLERIVPAARILSLQRSG